MSSPYSLLPDAERTLPGLTDVAVAKSALAHANAEGGPTLLSHAALAGADAESRP